MPLLDPDEVRRETDFLLNNPQFYQRPATIIEFLGPRHLNIEGKVRPGLRQALVDIFGNDVSGDMISKLNFAMFTGAIGIGKTTIASIILPYMCHWVLCLSDPQDYFNLISGSRIAFMMMSTSEDQAREVLFGDVFARIKHSEWFMENYPFDPKFTKQIRFEKDIWILPGDSSDTTFEGYNILGGIIDEMDSHKVTKDKDYADAGYDAIQNRISSRFQNRGLLVLIGQMKKATGFASKKYKEFLEKPDALVVRMTIWDSFGWDKYLAKDGTRDSFWYDTRRKQIVPSEAALLIQNANLLEIPNTYLENFRTKPEKALRDLAGIPPETNDPFISLVGKIDDSIARWKERHGELNPATGEWEAESPVTDSPSRPQFQPWFQCNGDPRKRVMHLDLATSGDGDALGMAMGYVEAVKDIDGEKRPYIVIDFALRIKVPAGSEIFLSEVRRIIYHLKDDLHFRLKKVTMDGFQSTDTMQQLRRRRFEVEQVSVDKSTLPYEDLREAIYDERIEIPPYQTYLNPGSDTKVDIVLTELMTLQDTGQKIDHPQGGSKDTADAIAGVVSTLMGDRTYRRGVASLDAARQRRALEDVATGTDGSFDLGSLSALGGNGVVRAPMPPLGAAGGLSIPDRLRPRR